MIPRLFEGCTASPWAFPLYFYRPDAALFRAGDSANGAFVLLSGSVRLGTQLVFRDGDAIGFESLFTPVYARTARATQFTLAFFIPAVALRRMIALEPRLAVNIARIEYARLERVRSFLPPLDR